MSTVTSAYRGGHNSEPGWWFTAVYDEVAIEEFKTAVPAKYRAWNEHEKRWWVSLHYLAAAIEVYPGLQAYTQQGALL